MPRAFSSKPRASAVLVLPILGALAAVVQAATVTDTDGNPIDTDEFFGSREEAAEDDAADETSAEDNDEEQ